MKLSVTFLLVALCYFSAFAQTPENGPQRNIRIKIFEKDSVELSYNNDFNMIEDSCSLIIRHAHLTSEQKFNGRFEDLSTADPQIVITKGFYQNGMKQGPFTINYPNGKLQAKGSFKDDLFDGKWELFYEDGKPKLSFEAAGNDIKVTDAWDAAGIKTVNNGNGLFKADLGLVYWKGKLLNGKPDGAWKSKITANDQEMNSEKFKNGVFQQGSSAYGDYNISRLMLVTVNIFPFVQAERFLISRNGCGETVTGNIVYAHYAPNSITAAERVISIVDNYVMNYIDKGRKLTGTVILEGEINQKGMVQNIHAIQSSFEGMVLHEIIGRLATLPKFIPATIDNKPIVQKFKTTIEFNGERYKTFFQPLPISGQ